MGVGREADADSLHAATRVEQGHRPDAASSARRLADTEVSGDRLDGHAALAAPCNRDDVLAELLRRGEHDDTPISASLN